MLVSACLLDPENKDYSDYSILIYNIQNKQGIISDQKTGLIIFINYGLVRLVVYVLDKPCI